MNRKLSDTQRVVWLVEREGSLNAAAVVRINGPLDEKHVRTALDLLQKRHPALRTRIDISGGIPPLAPEADHPAPIPLRIVARLDDDQWQDEAKCDLSSSLSWSPVPLLKVVLLQSKDVNDIILTLHRVMNDDASTMYLCRDLLGLLVQVARGDKNPHLRNFPERRLLDDLPRENLKVMDSLLHTTALLAKRISHLLSRTTHNKPQVNSPRAALPKPVDDPQQSGCARLLDYVLTAQETQMLLERCEAECATVQDALVAAVLQAVGQHMSHSSVAHPSRIRCISSNRLCRPESAFSGEVFGLFVLRSQTPRQESHASDFWDITRQASTSVPESASYGETMVSMALPHEIARRLLAPHSQVILVSNLGNESTPNRYNSIILQEHRTMDTWHGMVDCFGVMANNRSNRLALSFFYPERSLSEDRVGLLGSTVVKILRAALTAC